ncbi:MAG TPA: hypothetical protein DDZ81_02745 [Acetobacteraceae bacterium]|jgi:predicted 2-oxoglutarate/Fe(II)-dependent dioxygenase YbiX|nr:hypothetical protein [Acetobacteraceae bacterium]
MLETVRFSSQVGDPAPPCYGMASDGSFYTFEAQYGRPAILILVGAEATGELPAILAAMEPCRTSLASRGADMFVIVDDNPLHLLDGDALSVRAIDCGGFLTRCGVGPRETLALVVDRNLRIAMRADPVRDPAIATACLACLDALPSEQPRPVMMPAPAIVLPNLLSRAMCEQLIALFESSHTIDGTVARVDAAGRAANVIDHAKKHRRDMIVEPDSQLHRTLRDLLLDRCAPEIVKAFQARVAFTDRILVSRYDGPGGLFRRHRDNTAGNVAFREFALSVNLNAGEYHGGHLLFPEYNDHRHATSTGGGLIFSAAVLHEVAPVTTGSRYVLLTFFHGQQAEECRLAQAFG